MPSKSKSLFKILTTASSLDPKSFASTVVFCDRRAGVGGEGKSAIVWSCKEGKGRQITFLAQFQLSLFVRFSLVLSLHKVALLKMECGLPEMLLCR